MDEREFTERRHDLVERTVVRRGVHDPGVLDALREVPRHRFMPEHTWDEAYVDAPVPIGEGQTISQPYIVALMAELGEVGPGRRVLDVGTGSGYQAAVLSATGAEVYSIERIPLLASRARATLDAAGYGAVHTRVGDGKEGWPEQAPYDAILVAAAPTTVPEPLLDQLAVGGHLVIPVGDGWRQELLRLTRTEHGTIRRESVCDVLFVPLR